MHTVKRVCTLVLTGLLALPMAAPAGAAAASFSDLPSSHWAYIAMTEAAGYGILQGTGANTMSPSAPLTWPQFLAMAARAFAPEEYARSAASGAAWDQAGLDAARSAGLLEGLDEAALTGAVTRQDAAVVLCNALPEEYTPSFWDQPIDPTALSNWGRMDSLRQEAVAELARRCVIQGKADGSFGYADPLQRCDGAVLLMRVLEQVDNSCRGESQTVTLHILNADTGEALLPDQQVETEVSTYLSSLANGLDVGYYVYDYDRETASYTSTACDSYTLYFRPMTGAEIQEEQFWEKVERGEAAYEDYYKQDFWLSFQGDNARKHILLFGDESKSRFASQEEAAAAMTAVTVPVWQPSRGGLVPRRPGGGREGDLHRDLQRPRALPHPRRGRLRLAGRLRHRRAQLRHRHRHQRQRELPDPRRSGAGRELLGAGNQSPLHLPPLLRGAHLCRARLELGRRRLGLQQRRFRGLPRLYALLLHGRVTKQPTPGFGSGVGFHYPPLD